MRPAPDPDFAFTNPKSCPLDPAGSSGPAGVVPWIEGWGANAVGLAWGRTGLRDDLPRAGIVCLWQSNRPAPSPPLVLVREEKGKGRQMSGR